MGGVLVVVFWIWLLVALGVYAYRIYRRAAHGPKAAREQATAEGGAAGPTGLARFGGRPAPPLPEGPIEARLPRSLQDRPPPVPADPDPAEPAESPVEPEPVAPPERIDLADAVRGIELPEALLPSVDPDDLPPDDGRHARFSATGTTVPAVAAELAAELERIGYAVEGLDGAGTARARLEARRQHVVVTAVVEQDEESGTVVLRLSV